MPGHRSRSDAVRAHREALLDQAAADAARLEADSDDRAEMRAIERFMGMPE
ncbi:hypothetical protein GCM10027271_52130 [Saccharopolyspora gloriosae]